MQDRLNILVVTDYIPSDEEGGAATAAWELSKNLVRHGNRVVIITCGKKNLPKNENKEGIEIWRFGRNLIKCWRLSKQLIKNNKFDVINFHSPFSALGVSSLIEKNKIPAIYIFHSPWPEEYQIRSEDLKRSYLREKSGVIARKYLEGKVLQKCNRVIVLSNFIKERLKILHKFPSEKLTVIPGGIDLERFSTSKELEKLRRKLNLPEDKFILLTIRNLVSRMGLENLILALKDLVKIYTNIFLVIGGRGYLEKKLKDMVIELNLKHCVYFAGYIPDEILHEYYQTADLFILPTKLLEGFGLIILESLACGTPVLATPVGAIVEILERFDKKFLFRGTAPEDIAEGIKEFLDHQEEYPDLREKCRKFVEENYSWDKFTTVTEKIIYELKEN